MYDKQTAAKHLLLRTENSTYAKSNVHKKTDRLMPMMNFQHYFAA